MICRWCNLRTLYLPLSKVYDNLISSPKPSLVNPWDNRSYSIRLPLPSVSHHRSKPVSPGNKEHSVIVFKTSGLEITDHPLRIFFTLAVLVCYLPLIMRTQVLATSAIIIFLSSYSSMSGILQTLHGFDDTVINIRIPEFSWLTTLVFQVIVRIPHRLLLRDNDLCRLDPAQNH